MHFSCYLRYMEEAEHAFWRSAGLSVAPLESDYGWPRVAVTCDYRRPLRFELPVAASINVPAMVLTALAALAIFRLRVGALWTLAGCALAGLGYWLAAGGA